MDADTTTATPTDASIRAVCVFQQWLRAFNAPCAAGDFRSIDDGTRERLAELAETSDLAALMHGYISLATAGVDEALGVARDRITAHAGATVIWNLGEIEQ